MACWTCRITITCALNFNLAGNTVFTPRKHKYILGTTHETHSANLSRYCGSFDGRKKLTNNNITFITIVTVGSHTETVNTFGQLVSSLLHIYLTVIILKYTKSMHVTRFFKNRRSKLTKNDTIHFETESSWTQNGKYDVKSFPSDW